MSTGVNVGCNTGENTGNSGWTAPLPTGTGELLFSDMESSPVGAWVWLYGTELPTTPVVLLGATQCTIKIAKAEWLPATQTSLALDRVCITIPTFTGTENITITGVTGSISFSLSAGSVFEVSAPNGRDMGDYNSGDRVYFRAGTYDIASGGDGQILSAVNGQVDVAFCGYPGETAVIDIVGNLGFRSPVDETVGTMHLCNLKFLGNNTGVAIALEIGGHHTGGVKIIGNLMEGSGTGSQAECMGIGRHEDTYILANSLLNNGTVTSTGHEIYHGGWQPLTTCHVSWNHSTGYKGRFSWEFFGHTNGEELENLYIEHNMIDRLDSPDSIGESKVIIAVGGTDGRTSGSLHCNPLESGKWIVNALINANTVINITGVGATTCPTPTNPPGNTHYRATDMGCNYTFTNNYSDQNSRSWCCYNTMTDTGNSWN